MAEQDLDRNEAATPYKLEKAREKGQVGKSADLVAALVFAVAAVALYAKGADALVALFRYDQTLFGRVARVEASAPVLWGFVRHVLADGVIMLVPLFAAIMLAAVLGTLVQTGVILSVEPIKPDFDRLNPAAGFKRFMSVRTLFDTARALAKLVLMGVVGWHALVDLVPRLLQLGLTPPRRMVDELAHMAGGIGVELAVLLLLIAAADMLYTRREFGRKMRMSRRELKDEHKQREGDPRVRARLRELRREALRRCMAIGKTSTADVVVTNPTHYAVALRYEQGRMAAPQLVAKGAGMLAAGIRTLAARHGVPVVQNPPLARELYRIVDIEHAVPPSLYAPVARILVWIYAQRELRARGAKEATA